MCPIGDVGCPCQLLKITANQQGYLLREEKASKPSTWDILADNVEKCKFYA